MLGSDSHQLLPSTFPKVQVSSLLCDCESCSHKVRRKQSSTCQINMCLTWRQEDSDKSAFNICTQIAKYEHIAPLCIWMPQSSVMDLLFASEWLPSNQSIAAAFMHSWTRIISRRLLREAPLEWDLRRAAKLLRMHWPRTCRSSAQGWRQHLGWKQERCSESVGTWGWMSTG